eukprot:SAG31_NODE_874_length_11319_cov_3.145098_12_plen_59_part_00
MRVVYLCTFAERRHNAARRSDRESGSNRPIDPLVSRALFKDVNFARYCDLLVAGNDKS